MSSKILFILHLPPPIHGAAMMGKYIQESELIDSSFDSYCINLASRQFIRYRTYKFQKTVEICIASEAYLPRCKRYSSRIGLYYPECRGESFL